MLLQEILLWMFTVVGMISFLHMAMYICGANIYDTLELRRRHLAKKQAATAAGGAPHVTVLIPAHNEQLGVIRTIESVQASTYRNVSIVVIDDASTDDTAALVRNYIAEHASRVTSRLVRRDGQQVREYYRTEGLLPICLLHRQKNAGKAAGLNYALTHAVQSGLTMTLDADSTLQPQAIANAVRYFQDEQVVGVAANVKIMEQHTMIGMLQKFEHMIGYRSKKFYTLTNSEFIVGGVGSTYRYDVLQRVGFYDTDTVTEDIGLSMKIVAEGNRQQRIVYAADVVATTEGVQKLSTLFRQRYRWKLGSLQNLIKYRTMLASLDSNYSRALTLYRLPMAFLSEIILLMQPLLMSFAVYLSIVHHTLSLLIGGIITVIVYTLWTIWPDEHHSWQQKAQLSLYTPGMYFCFLIMDTVQIVAIFRCLAHAKQLTARDATPATWVSPERAGAAA